MNTQPSASAPRHGRWIAAALVCIAVVYGFFLSPAPGPSGDNAELQYLGKVLGISHPTGYPLYLLATHVFQWAVPFGTLAWKINLFSLLCALAALAGIAAAGRSLGLPGWSLFIALGWLSSTSAWWRLGTVAEVYAPHAAFTFWTLLLFLRWESARGWGWLAAGIFLHALSYANHLTTLLLLPVLALMVWRVDRREFTRGRTLAWTFSTLLAAASLYAYLFLRSQHAPDPDVYTRIDSARAFLDYVTGSQYRAAMFPGTGAEGLWAHTLRVARLLGHDYTAVGIPALAGLAIMTRRARVGGMALVCCLALQLLVVWQYRIADIHDYLMPLGGCLALGLAAVLTEGVRAWSALGRPARVAALAAGCALSVHALHRAAGEARFLQVSRNGADAATLRVIVAAAPGTSVLLCPHWQPACIAKYFTRGEGLGGGGLDARIWTPADAAGQPPARVREALARLQSEKHPVFVYSREGHPFYDLISVLRKSGAEFTPIGTNVWVMIEDPKPAPAAREVDPDA